MLKKLKEKQRNRIKVERDLKDFELRAKAKLKQQLYNFFGRKYKISVDLVTNKKDERLKFRIYIEQSKYPGREESRLDYYDYIPPEISFEEFFRLKEYLKADDLNDFKTGKYGLSFNIYDPRRLEWTW